MQLIKKKASVKEALSAATCTLLSATTSQAAEVNEDEWKFDSAVLLYSETDRVSALEPTVLATKQYGEDKLLNWKFVLDTLTGASHNGAVPTNEVQTFTRPSGDGEYTINPNEVPLDDTFHDTRVNIAVHWQQPWRDNTKLKFGANASGEYDFKSLGVNGAFATDFNQRNTTLTAGLSFEFDQIDPVGGVPQPFAAMAAAGATQPRIDSGDTKSIVDFLVGVSQVINKDMVMQWNYSLSQANGYLTDPYKVLSVIEDRTVGATEALGALMPTDSYRYENRPGDRTKHSFYWLTKYHLPNDHVVDFSYRYMTDDWGINSHTLDFHYRWELGNESYFEPHVRYYQQSAADFYKYFLGVSELPSYSNPDADFMSSDYRLGEMTAYTFGLKYQKQLGKNSSFNIRTEFYQQTGNSSPDEAVGLLKDQNLYEDVSAYIIQAGYSFVW